MSRSLADASDYFSIIVRDCASPLAVGNGGVDRVGEIDEEELVEFVQDVSFDRDRDRLRDHSGGERQCAGGGRVVARCDGGVVGGTSLWSPVT